MAFDLITARNMLTVFGILMVMIIISTLIITSINSMWYGTCWGNARNEMRSFGKLVDSIKSPDSIPFVHPLSLGSCIGGVVFVNGKNSDNKIPYIDGLLKEECSEYSGYKSYMVAIPTEAIHVLEDPQFQEKYGEFYEEQMKEFRENVKVWDAVKLWFKDKVGKIPPSYCWEFEHEFSSQSIISLPTDFHKNIFTNWNTGKTYCLKVSTVAVSSGQGTPTSNEFNYKIEIDPHGCLIPDSEPVGEGEITVD